MAKCIKDNRSSIGGTSYCGVIVARESAIRAWLGEPGEGDGYKVSLKWRGRVIEDETTDLAGRVFTLYDWKETNLYDEDLLTPAHLHELNFPREWHIGGFDEKTADLVKQAFAEWEDTK